MTETGRQHGFMRLTRSSRLFVGPFWLFLLAVLLGAAGCGSGEELEIAAIEPLTPRPTAAPEPAPAQPETPWTRVAWTRDVGAGTDVISFGDQLVLMGYDSRDGLGERVIQSQPASYAKPLITPSGGAVVYSLRAEDAVFVIEWGQRDPRRLADGFALAAWADPDTGEEWVYVGDDQAATDPPSYRSIYRYLLEDPRTHDLVWDAQPVSGDSFQLSVDGRYAGALFPWPHAGIADLSSGTWTAVGEGCWTAFAGDGNNLFWYFDGSHRNLTLIDTDTDRRWQVPINNAPGIDGFEVYHPRWTNDSRFLVMTGPYTVGQRANKIRGGGNQVEIWIGQFAADFSSVEKWRQITHNDAPDFYPDAWIDPRERTGTGTMIDRPDAPPSAQPNAADSRLVVEVRAKRDTVIPTPESIAPYRHGLLALEYDVLDVLEGSYNETTIVAAHWVIRDRAVLDTADRSASTTLRLTLELYDTHQELEGERLVMDTMDTNAFTLPLYYDVLSLP